MNTHQSNTKDILLVNKNKFLSNYMLKNSDLIDTTLCDCMLYYIIKCRKLYVLNTQNKLKITY